MPDLVSALRDELARLEAELAADPRAQKAEKIRELLGLYGPAPNARGPHPNGSVSDLVIAVPAIQSPPAKIAQFCASVMRFLRPEGTAAVARSRLVDMAKTNNWPHASPVWAQIDQSPIRHSVSAGEPRLSESSAQASGSVLAPASAAR
jgi:hypothetical protein